MVLNFNTGKRSWWLTNSVGCWQSIPSELFKSIQQQEQTGSEESRNLLVLPSATTLKLYELERLDLLNNSSVANGADVTGRPTSILDEYIQKNCFLAFYWIEISQSAIMIVLGVI
jgi:hypothetical protein